MRDVLCRTASWVRFDKRKKAWAATDPPHDVASTVLARAGEWGFSTVAGIITTPTMRPDGTILDQPGYDPATRLLLVDPPPLPPIPETPTKDDAIAALKLLEELLVEFPLVDDVAKAVALSTLITPVVRGAFPVAPMHIADAPVPSSGKSFLFDTTSAIAIGQAMPVIAAGRTEEETEKRLGAALLAGQSLITIDNVNGELRGDALCQIVERPRPQVRILGRSELIDVETRGTTLFANGNNITIVGDLCRRVVGARLDPRMERPELRVFTGNPVATVLADRGAYIAAALTICRAYVAAGRPGLKPRLASFEDWSDTVRSALTWLGKADPVDSMEMVMDEDPERVALGALLAAWGDTIGVGWQYRVPLKEVIAMAVKTRVVDQATNTSALSHPELSAAVRAVVPANRPPDLGSLGLWLRGNKKRIVNDMRFEAESNKHTGKQWWVQRTDNGASPPAM
jgi:putative DNA primase/helicase